MQGYLASKTCDRRPHDCEAAGVTTAAVWLVSGLRAATSARPRAWLPRNARHRVLTNVRSGAPWAHKLDEPTRRNPATDVGRTTGYH